MTLQNVGPAGCPAASHAGPTTSFRVAISFGTERVPENGTVMPFFSPEGGVLLYFEAHSPAQLEFVTLGHYEPPIPPFGRALTLEIPLVETVPGAPFASGAFDAPTRSCADNPAAAESESVSASALRVWRVMST